MKEKQSKLSKLPAVLLPWYDANGRSLPWREDTQPYHIWLSEIMLQQTRVEAVKGYYKRFLEKLPTIAALAAADDDELHKLWEGLGYYSRVRNLKKAANVIMQAHRGVFPREYEAVRALPGIGEYTAGAICSIAFGQKTPAVDGNVLRIYTRLFSDATPIDIPAFKKKVSQELRTIYPDRTGAFTQALMELGATVCGPNKAPRCEACPCRNFCDAFSEGSQQKFPVKKEKKARKIENKTVFILRCGDHFALQHRPQTGLLAGLWEFPNVEGQMPVEQAMDSLSKMGLRPERICRQAERKHIFTHIQWNMRCYYLTVKEPIATYTWLTAEEIQETAALPTAFRQFWDENALL